MNKILYLGFISCAFFYSSNTLASQEQPNRIPLIPGTFICRNNPNPSCQNPERYPANFNIEKACQNKKSFVCLNNPSPGSCGNIIPYLTRFSETFNIEKARQDKKSFVCLNNPRPSCGNSINFIRD